MDKLITLINKTTHALGFHLIRTQNSLPYRRAKYFSEQEITLLLDVGANRGQYAREVRQSGYSGKIISFEPIPGVYQILMESCRNDPLHICKQLALGAIDGSTIINILNSDASSSILTPNLEEISSIQLFQKADNAVVAMKTLDGIRDEIFLDKDRAYLKIDTQGYEMEVINGARNTLDQVAAIEVELSFVELYTGQPTLPVVWKHLEDLGYRSIWLERGYVNPATGHMLQCNAIFAKLGKR